ncbi:MAG: HD-GYP domain-containing protein [Mariprofundus sp.]
MTKYIDLLRQHQGKQSKPLAGDDDQEAMDQNSLFAAMPDEVEKTSNSQPSEADEFNNHELLADDEIENENLSTLPLSEASTNNGISDSHVQTSSWLMQTSKAIADFYIAGSSNSPHDIQPLIEQLDHFLERLAANPALIDELELEVISKEKQIHALNADLGDLIQKAVMMMLYAIKMGQRLQLNNDELRSHILAAMTHHVGMAQVPSEIRHKKEKLSKDEIKEIRKAPEKSHDFLNRCGITDAAILQAASQAQERYDGSGPRQLPGPDIAFSARMVSLLSMFEALIHYRPYRQRLLPRDAIRKLVKQHKQAFDPKMLKALIESISLYPVGTYVQLNSGDVGLVIRVHPRLPLRPVVRIMMDARGGELPIRDVDLKAEPNLMVQQCMYQEELENLKTAADGT